MNRVTFIIFTRLKTIQQNLLKLANSSSVVKNIFSGNFASYQTNKTLSAPVELPCFLILVMSATQGQCIRFHMRMGHIDPVHRITEQLRWEGISAKQRGRTTSSTCWQRSAQCSPGGCWLPLLQGLVHGQFGAHQNRQFLL